MISSGSAAFAPKKQPLTLTANSSSKALESSSSVVGELRYVAGEGNYRVAELRAQPRGSLRDAIKDPDAGTFFDEPRHDSSADPRAAAGYQCHLPIEPTHHQVLLSGSDGAGPRRRPATSL